MKIKEFFKVLFSNSEAAYYESRSELVDLEIKQSWKIRDAGFCEECGEDLKKKTNNKLTIYVCKNHGIKKIKDD